MKARYLAFFSYIGTHFRASEKLWLKEGRNLPDPGSVQGVLEFALQKKFKPLNYPYVVLSSRTDGGVHALNTSAHFDLERFGPKIHYPEAITYQLNSFFNENDLTVSIRECLRVNDNFHARFLAKSRCYLYRLAVLKKGVTLPENTSIASFIPIEEWRRCHYLRLPNFDIEKFKHGTKYFVGYHDFSTFKKFDKLNQHKQNRRQILSIDVSPGRPQVTSFTSSGQIREDVFDYWDIRIHGRGFVHNQIRRMIGTLISVSIGKLPHEEIKVMLQVPSKYSWHHFIPNCPPNGLYLCNVEYDPKHLIYDPEVQFSIHKRLPIFRVKIDDDKDLP